MREYKWDTLRDFIYEVMGDSPHCADKVTMDWFYEQMQMLEEVVVKYNYDSEIRNWFGNQIDEISERDRFQKDMWSENG